MALGSIQKGLLKNKHQGLLENKCSPVILERRNVYPLEEKVNRWKTKMLKSHPRLTLVDAGSFAMGFVEEQRKMYVLSVINKRVCVQLLGKEKSEEK
ncbi:hypothetical protein CCACVL1_01969, partial [Corchorus capsularis]